MDAVDLYLSVRAKEGRIYPDDIAARLPIVPHDHPLAGEWKARADSCARLVDYLKGLSRPLTILEVGCGNGWLARRLATLPAGRVWGLDRVSLELAQAARLFGSPNLAFLAADIFDAPFANQLFDAIVLASTIQYFHDLPALIRTLLKLLVPGGEIHLLDSPLYQPEELSIARQRSLAYYAALGFPEMSAFYFHHPISALDGFSPRWHYRPGQLRIRLGHWFGNHLPPFPWVSITRNRQFMV